MNEDFSEIIAAVKKFAVDNLSLSTLSDEELEEQIKTITDNMIGNRYVSIKNRVDIAQQVFSSIRGFGLLDTIMNDDTITEVMINGADNIFIEQAGRVKRLDESFESQRKLEDIIQRIVGKAGREVNQSNPIVDTRLPDGSRVNVVLPPIALCGPTVTIRKFSKTPMTIEKLISYGSITREIADKLKLLVEAKYNIFICGGTGSGKTTFLNALSNYIPKDERVITIEDSAELQIKGVDNLVSLETRNANASGAGAVTIRDLIKSSLRMRPERIVVGEVRGGEALDMLQAMNTGHDGSLSTGHANSTQDMLSRLETMVLQGADGLPLEAIRQQISSAIDIIIHLSRLRDHSRKTMEITEVLGFENGQIKLNPLYVFEEDENTTLEIVFFCMFFLIYIGMYILQSVLIYTQTQKVASIVSKSMAVTGYEKVGKHTADNVNFDFKDNKYFTQDSVNTIYDEKAKLYRYFYPDPIAGNSDIESINSSLTSLIDNLSIISGGGVTCDINAKNYFINQTVSVTIKREGAIPEVFSYIGMDGVSSDITVTATAASCDGAEFVRNTDMVYDFVTFLSDRLHISDKISYLKEKVQGVFQEDAKEAANAAG